MNKMGFGFLRLPHTSSGTLDMDLLNQMVDAFLERGGTYFDTAYTYLGGQSEIALREAVVKRHPRDRFQIADKLPSWMVHSTKDCQRYFHEQRERCGVDFFDVYLSRQRSPLRRNSYRSPGDGNRPAPTQLCRLGQRCYRGPEVL